MGQFSVEKSFLPGQLSVEINTLEFGPHNIGVFALLPGSTDTPLLRGTRTDADVAAIKGLNPPEHVADAVMPLLSPDAIAYNGACISIARREA